MILRALFAGIAVIWLLTGSVHAQMIFGAVPNQNSLIRSEEEAKLFCAYLEDRIDDRILVRLFKDEDSLYKGLRKKEIDLAVVSNVFYYEHAGGLQLLANFTRSEEKTHRLLLIVPKNSPVRSMGGLKTGKRTLVLDEWSRSRIAFLTKAVKGDPERIFKRIIVAPQVVDALSGLSNGTYDAACVEDGLLETVQRFDPGLVREVRTLKASDPLASDPVVSRKGLSSHLVKNIKEVLLDMESDSDGQQILLGVKITRFVPPITQRSFYPEDVDPAQYRQPPKKKVETASAPEPVLAPVLKIEETPKVSKTPSSTTATKEEQAAPDRSAETEQSAVSTPLRGKETTKTVSEVIRKESQKIKPKESATEKGKTVAEKTEETVPVQGEEQKVHYSIFAIGAAVSLFVLFLIVLFLVLKWKREQRESATRIGFTIDTRGKKPEAQTLVSEKETPREVSHKKPVEEQKEIPFGKETKTSLVELRGELKTFRVPDLLQLMASCRNTGALVIRSKHDEKCLYFRNGKICAASCFDKDNKNKIGYLLIKVGLVTEKERARALAMCAEDPSKRLGKALVEIGAVRKEDIRDVLRLQAQEIVYSIYVYPEGRFEFIDKEPVVDPEEDLSLDVMNLLMEGARREDEWDKMRQAIPSMDIILEFAEGGKEKLNGNELNKDQELVLSMINGERSVREICVKSTMVDFEVCNFLYRLINLSVLEKVEI